MNIKLSSILLFALVIPFIMNYRLSPGTTPFWLFGLIFLVLLTYLILDIIKLKKNIYNWLKYIFLWLSIIGVLGSAFISAIVVRHQTHPVYMIHDMPLQQEIAIRFFLDGKNPYATDYFGTFLEQWHYSENQINPALYHFVLPPFYILFALPFYFFSHIFFGFFDGRIPLFFLFLTLLILGSILVKEHEKRLLFLTLLAFSPATLPHLIEGRSDIFMYAFLFLGFLLLEKKYFALSSISTALAFAVKQSAWPVLPFYLAYIYFRTKNSKKAITSFILLIMVFGLIVGPFLLWNTKALLDSTIFYLSGGIAHSYPISGYGLGMFLNEIGIIKDLHQYYPFHIWQILIGLPLAVILIHFLKNKTTVGRLILVYGIFLTVVWYLSRYLNDSHLGYISMVFITSYFWPEKEVKDIHEK